MQKAVLMNAETSSMNGSRMAKGDSGYAGKVKSFLVWWLSELNSALPSTWRDNLGGSAKGLPAAILGNEIVSFAISDQGLKEQRRLPFAADDSNSIRDTLYKLISESDAGSSTLIAVIPDSGFVSKVIELPAAAEEALQQVVGFELDRYTPFRAEQAYFAAKILSRSEAQNLIKVQIVASPREVVEKMVGRLQTSGFKTAAVYPWLKSGETLGVRDFNLLPRNEDQVSGWSLDSKLALAAGCTFVLLMLLALLLPVWQKRETVMTLLSQLNSVKDESAKVQKVRTELEQIASDSNFIQSKKHAHVPMALLIEDLSRAFPDNTWIAAFELKSGKQRELILTGETASATKVIEQLEQIPYLKNPSFRSPITKLPGQGNEKFVIGVEIKPRPLPVQQPLIVQASPASPPLPPAASVPLPVGPTSKQEDPAKMKVQENAPPKAVDPDARAPAGNSGPSEKGKTEPSKQKPAEPAPAPSAVKSLPDGRKEKP